MAAQPQDAESGIESEVRRIRGLIDKHAYAEALSVASALLEQAPGLQGRHRSVAQLRALARAADKRTRAVRRAHYWPPNL